MFRLIATKQFDKDVKLMKMRSAKNDILLKDFLKLLQVEGAKSIPLKHRPHKLSGNYSGSWEAHIKPDLLIIWFEVSNEGEITLLRLGSHSDLF